MPGDNKGVRTVQTMLASKRPGSNDSSKDSTKEKPSKQNKRSHSDVANESVEGIDLTGIQNDLSEIKKSLEEKITSKFECKIREANGKLDDKLDTLMIENEDLRERIRAKDRVIENLVEKVGDNNNRCIDALKLANYNEQYSRKHNIRMLNFPEKRGENLKKAFVELVNSDCNANIEPRILEKKVTRSLFVKVRNTDTKIRIMRQQDP
ncbi:Hypothetical predicted protein [Mytilus galloprovincialis]|uniref:Uncharacterized protein n=1 Tax=Mytilus galloprovincialis TaxID=29158 RepID=A0A8B6CI83_MYTGA|nr:Hypothetical predicted protein [Mytilus galloprovincialis]